MKKTMIVLSLITLLLFSSNAEKKKEPRLITLSNGTLEIKLLPDVGGTLVSASLTGHENILYWEILPGAAQQNNDKLPEELIVKLK